MTCTASYVNGNSVLQVDTTFELVEGLWLSDTTYTNKALIHLKGKMQSSLGQAFGIFVRPENAIEALEGKIVIKPELLKTE